MTAPDLDAEQIAAIAARAEAEYGWRDADEQIATHRADVLALLAEVERLRVMQRGTATLLDNWTRRAEKAEAERDRINAERCDLINERMRLLAEVERLTGTCTRREHMHEPYDTITRLRAGVEKWRASFLGVSGRLVEAEAQVKAVRREVTLWENQGYPDDRMADVRAALDGAQTNGDDR